VYEYNLDIKNPFSNQQEEVKYLFTQFNSLSKNMVINYSEFWNNDRHASRIIHYDYGFNTENKFPYMMNGFDENGDEFIKIEFEYYN